MSITTGSRLGPYEVQRLIGKGGMGEVYRAHDTRLDRGVALKVLAPKAPTTEQHFVRFAREARAAALVNHPNVVTVYDIGAHEGTPFVVSELLEGETLRAHVSCGKLPLPVALEYARQIAEGLAAAHRLEVVHRDLKPENIFITQRGHVKILDFGLAKCREQAIDELSDPSASTQPGVLLGTVGYMSPEQVRGKTVDHRSDLFSLGVILYEMLSGSAPFRGDSAIDTLGAILRDEPQPLTAALDIPPALDAVVRHCLEKDREARFQSARDLLFNLQLLASSRQTETVRRGSEARPRATHKRETRRLFHSLAYLLHML